MEKIYTIGYNKGIAEAIGTDFILVPELRENEIHDWVVELFKNEIPHLVIALPVDNEQISKLIKIALHIRLSLNDLKEKALIPLIFTSTLTFQQLILKAKGLGIIFSTEGTYFIATNKIKQESIGLKPILAHEYKTGFLNIINIKPDETVGKHSLANIWGAYTLDKVAKTKVFDNIAALKRQRTQLYLKFTAAYNFDFSILNPKGIKIVDKILFGTPIRIEAAGKRILLIDDEAEKGWDSVLRKIFKVTNADDFKVINEKVSDYVSLSHESKLLIENGKFDLFLIDLRLNGLEEELDRDTSEFSGFKVLKKIKELNRGNQAIIFTASNKTWNLKYILDEGANGYYLKESPEFNFSLKFSEKNYENFRKEAQASFYYNFLREVETIRQTCLKFISNDLQTRSPTYQEFYERSKSGLEIGFTLLEKSHNESKYLSFAFLAFYQILEDYSNQEENFCKDSHAGYYFVDDDKPAIDINEKEWVLKTTTGGVGTFKYFEIGHEVNDHSIGSLAKISFILYLKFAKSNADLLLWGKINNVRNTKAGHGTANGDVDIHELFQLLDLVKTFLTTK